MSDSDKTLRLGMLSDDSNDSSAIVAIKNDDSNDSSAISAIKNAWRGFRMSIYAERCS